MLDENVNRYLMLFLFCVVFVATAQTPQQKVTTFRTQTMEILMPTIEKVFDSPGPQPNGMQATEEGLWILDQQTDEVHLVSYNGVVKKTLATDSDKGSGITHTAIQNAQTSGSPQPIVAKSCQPTLKVEKPLLLLKHPAQGRQARTA